MTIETISKSARALVMTILVIGVVFSLFAIERLYTIQMNKPYEQEQPFIGPIRHDGVVGEIPNASKPALQVTVDQKDLQPAIKGSSLDGQR
jgi:hypothetical protein